MLTYFPSFFYFSLLTWCPPPPSSHSFSTSDLCQRLGQPTRSVPDSHVAPIVSVFDELKDYLSDSDLSLDYKLARQRRKHQRKTTAVGARSLNRQAQLTSLIQANRKAAAGPVVTSEGSSRRGSSASGDGSDRAADMRTSVVVATKVDDGDGGIMEEGGMSAPAPRKTCAVTGHPRGRSLEPISEETHQLVGNMEEGHPRLGGPPPRGPERPRSRQSPVTDNDDMSSSSGTLKRRTSGSDSGCEDILNRRESGNNNTTSAIGNVNTSISPSSNSILMGANTNRALRAGRESPGDDSEDLWHIDNPYARPYADQPRGQSRDARTADPQLTAAGLSSCFLVSAAQHQLEDRGPEACTLKSVNSSRGVEGSSRTRELNCHSSYSIEPGELQFYLKNLKVKLKQCLIMFYADLIGNLHNRFADC